MKPLLEARGLQKSFGALKAVDGIDLTLMPGEVLGVIGPNGSGKTTLFNLLCGVLPMDAGGISLAGREITRWPEFRRCRAGLVKTDQADSSFMEVSVMENVMLGAVHGAGLGLGAARDKAREVLELTGLAGQGPRLAGELTVAMRRRLGLARALATGPKALLLDENLAGLTPAETDEALELLKQISAGGVALVMVEHVMHAVLGISQRLMVLDFGRVIAGGPCQEVMALPQVAQAYLGSCHA